MGAHRGNAGAANLRPCATAEEARKRGRAGGIASAAVRQRAKTMREWAEALRDVPAAGDGETFAGAAVLAMYKQAAGGNVSAFRALCEVMGETSGVAAFAAAVNLPPVVLGTIPINYEAKAAPIS